MTCSYRIVKLSCMTIRIPPSIAWLAKKYRSVKAELAELEKELAIMQARRDALRYDVESLARVISIHEVPIEASDIALKRKNPSQQKLQYGFLTKAILKYLSSLPSGQDASISEIFYAVMRIANYDLNYEWGYTTLRKSVAHQLRNMLRQNRVIRTVKGTGKYSSRYKLPRLLT